MGTLPITKYRNNERTVSGSVNVDNSDMLLNVDTSLVPCTINLQQIPSDYWSTLYKLYVKDLSGNASVNNITIIAPIGFKINNLQQIVIATDSDTALIRISSNTDYVAELGASFLLSVADTSTIDLTYIGGLLSGVVRYTDYFFLTKRFTNANTNYLPNIPIYNPAGTVSPTFYNEIAYAASLGIHDQKNYDTQLFNGAFSASSLDNTTGYVTIPTDGVYVFFARLHCMISNDITGSASLLSDNPNTSGIAWNNSKMNRTAYMQISICLSANNGGSNQATMIPLTDVGGFIVVSPTVELRFTAGRVIKLVILNNTDLPFYGKSESQAGIIFYGVKVSEL
jgi:hypothetical protein